MAEPKNIQTIHEHAEAMLDFSIERDEWDEIPMLSVMLASGDDEKPFNLILMGISGIHPGQFLEELAIGALMGKLEDSMLPRQPLLGLSLQSEGWGLREPSEDEMARYRSGTPIAELPSRIEIKGIISFDGEQLRSWAYERNGEKREETRDIGGRIPQALKDAFQALTLRAAGKFA